MIALQFSTIQPHHLKGDGRTKRNYVPNIATSRSIYEDLKAKILTIEEIKKIQPEFNVKRSRIDDNSNPNSPKKQRSNDTLKQKEERNSFRPLQELEKQMNDLNTKHDSLNSKLLREEKKRTIIDSFGIQDDADIQAECERTTNDIFLQSFSTGIIPRFNDSSSSTFTFSWNNSDDDSYDSDDSLSDLHDSEYEYLYEPEGDLDETEYVISADPLLNKEESILAENDKEEEDQEEEEEEEKSFDEIFSNLDLSTMLDEYFPFKEEIPVVSPLPVTTQTDTQSSVYKASHHQYAAHQMLPDPPMGTFRAVLDPDDISYDNPQYWTGIMSLAMSNVLSIRCVTCSNIIRCGSCIYKVFIYNSFTCQQCLNPQRDSAKLQLNRRYFVPDHSGHRCASLNDHDPFATKPHQGDFSDEALNFDLVTCPVTEKLYGCQGCGIVSCEKHYIKLLGYALARISDHNSAYIRNDALSEPFNDVLISRMSKLFGYNFFENASFFLSPTVKEFNERIKERLLL